MKLLRSVLLKAKTNPVYLWMLNRLLWKLIPFNRAHRVIIQTISDDGVIVRLPFRKSNRNHLNSMHACALATLCEYASGIGLMTRLDPTVYRILLKEISIDYLLQAKSVVYATFELNDAALQQELIIPLHEKGSIIKTFTVAAHDNCGEKICVGEITWQLKEWERIIVRS